MEAKTNKVWQYRWKRSILRVQETEDASPNDVELMDHEDCQERHDMKTTEALIRQTGGRRQQDLEKLGEAAGELVEHQENAKRGHS